MINLITPQRVANQIAMLRSQRSNKFITYILVEGITDAKVFGNIFNTQVCKVEIAHSKNNAIIAIEILESRKIQGVLAIVDSDYSCIVGYQSSSSNVFFTDTHDLETTIISSPALEKVLKEYMPEEKLDYALTIAEKVRGIVIRVAVPIGCLRWISIKESLNLTVSDPPIIAFLDDVTYEVNIANMIKSMKNIRQTISLTDKDIEYRILEIMNSNIDPWHLCQGHDLVHLLVAIFPQVLVQSLGRRSADQVKGRINYGRIAESLRLSYELSYFTKTRLYRLLLKWQEDNKPYIIF